MRRPSCAAAVMRAASRLALAQLMSKAAVDESWFVGTADFRALARGVVWLRVMLPESFGAGEKDFTKQAPARRVGCRCSVLMKSNRLGPDRSPAEKAQFKYRQRYGVIVVCEDERHQRRVFERLRRNGLNLKVVVV